MTPCRFWVYTSVSEKHAAFIFLYTKDGGSMLLRNACIHIQVYTLPLLNICSSFNVKDQVIFLRRGVVSPTPNPQAVRDCLFSILTSTLHVWKPSSPSATWGRAVPGWRGSRLTWLSTEAIIRITRFCILKPCSFTIECICMFRTIYSYNMQ
jgi:hypothetical protein